jgi:monooxygenase
VGAGISGIGVAYHLAHRLPGKRFAILESRETFGGTWAVNRYPGVRSDSDMFTFGYSFKPWLKDELATGEQIQAYLREVIDENNLGPHIRYQHRVTAATWSSGARQWSVEVTRLDTGERLRYTADFLWMCQGYYRQDEGYTPGWPGMAEFNGPIVHPLTWPEDLDYAGKRVLVIGSGATAATLIPAIAEETEHVTMLQRSPTFYLVRPNVNELAETLRELDIPDEWTHEIVRRRISRDMDALMNMSFDAPDALREFLLEAIRPLLPEGFDVERHFSPTYRPWQQRIAVLPEGDLFTSIREGKVSIVTDQIDRFVPTGVRLASGDTIEADIIVTATGFNMSVMGDIAFSVDGAPVDFAQTVTYRGLMFTGVPNLVYVFGYFRASWTLRVDLISDFVCRLLAHMDERGATMVVPALRDDEVAMARFPWVDPENFNPGYLARSLHLLPQQGDHEPWRLGHEYSKEKELLPAADLDDGTLVFK